MINLVTVIYITTKKNYTRLSIMVTDSEKDDLDRLLIQVKQAFPGIEVSRAAVARMCIDKGLSALLAGSDNGV